MKIFRLLSFFLIVSTTSFGQLEQTKRLEFIRNNNAEEEYQVLPLGVNGVLMMHSKVDYYQKNLTLLFTKYDTTLTENWHVIYQPNDRYELAKVFDNEHFLYLLFREPSTKNIGILRVDFETGDKVFMEGKISVNMDIEHFVILKSNAYIGGKYNDRPVVLLFSLFDGLCKVFPDLHANNLTINELDIDEIGENIYIMLKNEHNCQFSVKTFSYEGKLLSSETFGERGHTPISGKVLKIGDDELLLMGDYSGACSLYSEGIYLHFFKQEKTNFINYSDLKNFFKFMKPKREQRMKDKIVTKKQHGNELKLQYRLLLHKIIPREDGFLLVAEIFYPEYKAPPNTMLNPFRNYRIGTNTYNNFRYTHAIICRFDKLGNLLWDNSFTFDDLESGELNERVQVTQKNDLFILAYPKDGNIRTELIRDSQSPQTTENFALKPKEANEKIVSTDNANLSAWYDGNFLAHGYQTIKNDKNASIQREVFFIDKLTYSLNLKENK